jgi:hypothetical protein
MEMIRTALKVFKAASQDDISPTSSSEDAGESPQDGTQPDDDSASAGSSDAGDTSPDSAGLTDDGKLDDATSNQLIAAHCV